MKKELVAVAILVLILAASLINISFVDSRMGGLSSQVKQAGRLVDEGRTDEASALLGDSLREWKSLDGYVHIMLRHDEIDPITDEYYALLDELRSGGDATSASFETLINRLNGLADMERLSLASVF